MKKIIILLLFAFFACIGSGGVEAKSKEKFEYQVNTSSEEWSQFNTKDEMVDAVRIPHKILKAMTTEELIIAVFEYPLIINILAYNEDEIALKEFEKECDAFKELIKREDAAPVLEFYIINLTEEQQLEKMVSKVLLNSKKIFNESFLEEEFSIITMSLTYPISGSVYTPNGSEVDVFEREEMSATLISIYNEYFIDTYPNATYVSTSTNKYNCHSYAWYSSSPQNVWWMNQSGGVGLYMSDGSYSRVYTAYTANVIYFALGDHSMKMYDAYSNSIFNAELISKWGAGPVMIHAVNYYPYNYSGYSMWN